MNKNRLNVKEFAQKRVRISHIFTLLHEEVIKMHQYSRTYDKITRVNSTSITSVNPAI